jgi:hypothetical protein
MTDHAWKRWYQRTPEDCHLTPAQAWQRGEDLEHPSVISPESEEAPDRVRLYRHGFAWTVLFLIETGDGRPAIKTVYSLDLMDFDPAIAYVVAYPSHKPEGDE